MLVLYVFLAVAAGLLGRLILGTDGTLAWAIVIGVIVGVAVTAGQVTGQRRRARSSE